MSDRENEGRRAYAAIRIPTNTTSDGTSGSFTAWDTDVTNATDFSSSGRIRAEYDHATSGRITVNERGLYRIDMRVTSRMVWTSAVGSGASVGILINGSSPANNRRVVRTPHANADTLTFETAETFSRVVWLEAGDYVQAARGCTSTNLTSITAKELELMVSEV